MDTMVNEEVMEATEIATSGNSGKTFKIAAGIGLVTIGSFVAYKYIIKPVIAKIKAQKAHQEIIELEDDEFEEVDEKNN